MQYLDFSTMDQQAIHKVLIGSVIPRPIALVLSKGKEGVINVAPFSHFNLAASDPAMISLGINRVDSKSKDTARNILHLKEFVVHIVTKDILKDANETAASLPKEESELKKTSFHLADAKWVNLPIIKEAKIILECKMIKHTKIKDGKSIKVDFFLAKVIGMHIADEVYADGKVLYEKLNPIGRLAGQDYTTLGEIISMKRPL